MRRHSVLWLQATLITALAGCRTQPQSTCDVHADCAANEACIDVRDNPESPLRDCVPATCRDHIDCAEGESCLTFTWSDGCSSYGGLVCSTPDDQCQSDADCLPGSSPDTGADWDGNTCYLVGEEPQCGDPIDCAIGRPLSVDGAARVAPSAARPDWSAPAAVRLPEPEVRKKLARHWLHVAALEHASVASFARFTLELMALGAPPELLRDSHAAGLDEIRHAQLAFGLAGRFAGHDLGPDRLSLTGVEPHTDPASILQALIVEGCVGETVGAALARAEADDAEDPVLAGILHAIAEDEARHAVLAWRTLHWICETWPELAAGVPDAVAHASAELREQLARGPAGARGVGLLGADEAVEVARRVALDVFPKCI